MNLQIENAIARIAEEARGRYFELVTGARDRTEKAAGRVKKSKKPVKTISRLGLKLTAVTHRTADKVWKRQTQLVEHQIDAFAGRLKAAAAATDLRDLVVTQIRLLPEDASRVADGARETLAIVAGAGGDVRDVVKRTVLEFQGKAPAAKRRPRKTAAPGKAAAKEPAGTGAAAGHAA